MGLRIVRYKHLPNTYQTPTEAHLYDGLERVKLHQIKVLYKSPLLESATQCDSTIPGAVIGRFSTFQSSIPPRMLAASMPACLSIAAA